VPLGAGAQRGCGESPAPPGWAGGVGATAAAVGAVVGTLTGMVTATMSGSGIWLGRPTAIEGSAEVSAAGAVAAASRAPMTRRLSTTRDPATILRFILSDGPCRCLPRDGPKPRSRDARRGWELIARRLTCERNDALPRF